MASKTIQHSSRLSSIGVDIGKDVFHIVGFDPDGKIVLRRKFKRLALDSEFEKLPRCISRACSSRTTFLSPGSPLVCPLGETSNTPTK